MEIYKMKDMKGGWYVGDFSPTAYRTKDFEVSYKLHPKGENWDTHYHKKADEVNFLVSGKMIIQGQTLSAGDIFVIKRYEIADPTFLDDCYIVCVKTVSDTADKYCVVKKEND